MIQLAIIAVLAASFLLALLVFVNNPRSILNRLYFLFSVLSLVWLTGNLFSTPGPFALFGNPLLFFARLITPSSLLALYVYIIFVYRFQNLKTPKFVVLLGILNLGIASFSFTNSNVYLSESGSVLLGGLYPFYGVGVLLNLATVFYILFHKTNRKSDTHDLHKKIQLNYLRLGVLLSFVPIIIFGVKILKS